MPATIETKSPDRVIKNIKDEDLPLLVTNGNHVYLATKIKDNDKNYILVYIERTDGTGKENFGENFEFPNLLTMAPWDGEVHIENN